MPSDTAFRVAIVGGGLGGIALGLALKRRGISFTLYEARSSFTEIGAGINLGPSAVRALKLIDPALGDKVYRLATRNPPPAENIWMHVVYGAPTGNHADGESVVNLSVPPTGSTALHRQELLKALAEEMDVEHARFNKKIIDYQQNNDHVVLKFADGTEETASVLIGCDGIHSRIRSIMFGPDNAVSKPHFAQEGAYRLLVPMEKAVELLGQSARQSTLHLGPGGYLVRYPVNSGTAMNCGAWTRRSTLVGEAWVVPEQKHQLEVDFKDWGDSVHKLISLFAPDTPFWAAHQHTQQPQSFHAGCVMLMGDGAHAMLPHQGAGASQAVEDALVLAEVLVLVQQKGGSRATIEAGLTAAEEVRKPRFLKVQEYSSAATARFYDFWGQSLEGDALQEWVQTTTERVEWVMGVDLNAEVEKAKGRFERLNSRSGNSK